jgi:hypothetical protein
MTTQKGINERKNRVRNEFGRVEQKLSNLGLATTQVVATQSAPVAQVDRAAVS